jgi:hypothetical protein
MPESFGYLIMKISKSMLREEEKALQKNMGRFGKSLKHVTCHIVGAYRAPVFSCEINERLC